MFFIAVGVQLVAVTTLVVAQGLPPSAPRLTGHHFRVTVVEEPGFVDFYSTGIVSGGYCVNIFATIASHANFTYELLPPSGMGSLCEHRTSQVTPYSHDYRSQYLCGQSDVNDRPNNFTSLVTEEYATDMYLGLFYVTPERQLLNSFSMSFHPPTTGALTFFGIATRIASVDDLIQQQKKGLQRPVCVQSNTAFAQYIEASFPDLQTVPYDFSTGDLYESFDGGACDIQVADNPVATRFILDQKLKNSCLARGQPLGIITAPLSFGFSQYAIGIRKDMPEDIVHGIDFWLNYHMVCSPNDENCDSFSKYYLQAGGTGEECGYVAYPMPDDQRMLSQGAIAGIAIGALAIVAVGLFVWHGYRLRKQRRRYKKRFVQQIARNINIGPSPREIPAETLAEEIQHISSSKNGIINKEDLRKWMFDIKLNFMSDKDFEALWNAMDVDGRGVVEPLEFFVFLSMCGPEFETVYHEVSNMSKAERLKWASRRLTNYRVRGETGVRKLEHELERRSRQNLAMYQGQLLRQQSSNHGSTPMNEDQSSTELSTTNGRLKLPTFQRSSSLRSNPNDSISEVSNGKALSFQRDSETIQEA